MNRLAVPIIILALLQVRSPAQDWPGDRSDWNGFARFDFQVNDRPVLVVTPSEPASGRPWVWHGEFFGHKPAPDIELLRRGFHIVYTRVPDMLGCPDAVAHWNQVYAELNGRYGLADRAALVGLSRGGLYCYNWAIANPDKVACIYGDAPVCDFRSWPGGFGTGKGSVRDWQLVLQRYGFSTDEQARSWGGNPVDQLEPLAEARVPLLHVFGDADDVVPWEENTGVIAERYRRLGGRIQLIRKPGVGHHPHGLDDPSPIVSFIEQHCVLPAAPPDTLEVLTYNIHHGEGTDGKLDLERIAGVIRRSQADLVALQEVDNEASRTGGVDQAAELARLTGMHVSFGPNIELQGGSYGNAVLSRFPIVAERNHPLPNLNNGEQRGALEVTVRLSRDLVCTLISTHFDHRRDPAERNDSAKDVCSLGVSDARHPVLLAGDMNAVPESEAIAVLQTKYVSRAAVRDGTFPSAAPTGRIDHVFCLRNSMLQPIEEVVIDEPVASDHRPIRAVFRVVPE